MAKSMVIVYKNMRQLCQIMIKYFNEQKFDLKSSWKTLR